MRLVQTQDATSEQFDYSMGVRGVISERKRKPRWLKRANNVVFRPRGCLTSRPGSRRITTWDGPGANYRCNTLAKFYSRTGGANKLFGFYTDGSTRGLYLVDGTSGTAQSLPTAAWGASPTDAIWSECGINGVLVMTQVDGSHRPMYFHETSGTWLDVKLPKPSAAPTTALVAGGAVDAGTHYYRTRWVYTNGSSEASPVTAAVTPGAGNLTVRLSAIHPASPRADYYGCIIERTKLNGTTAGRWFAVATVLAATATYDDTTADAGTNDEANEALHAPPVNFRGVVPFRNRLVGWDDRALYISQIVGDEEATGIFNFLGTNIRPIFTEDGDAIVEAIPFGDRVLVGKGNSIWVLEGDAPENFAVRLLADGVGFAGPRAACSIGAIAFFQSRRGWETLEGENLKRGSVEQVGHYFDEMTLASASRVASTVVQNEYVIFSYPANSSNTNTDMAVFDLRIGEWTHWKDWNPRDFLVQKDGAFGNATLLFADEASPHIYAALVGSKDGADSAGAGGTDIVCMLEWPEVDDLTPGWLKDWQRLEIHYRTGAGKMIATLSMNGGRVVARVPLELKRVLSKYGPTTLASDAAAYGPLPSGSTKNPGKYGGPRTQLSFTGIPQGTIGSSYALRIDATISQPLEMQGYVLSGKALPNRQTSEV